MQQGDWVTTAVELLTEVYDGPADPSDTWFVDNEPKSGILGTLRQVTAEQASQPPTCGVSTLAGHAGHLWFSLRSANAYARDVKLDSHWNASWEHQEVTEAKWSEILSGIRNEFDQLIRNLLTAPIDDQQVITGYLSTACHAAYHLGAMRQLAAQHIAANG